MKCLLSILCIVTLWVSSAFGVKREDVTPSYLLSLFQQFYSEDLLLKEHIENFPFQNYNIYLVENREIYYVDDVADFIKSQFVRRGVFYEVHVFEQLWRYTKPGTVAVDIGGHIGMHTLSLARFVENGTVHVFEPQLKLFAELVINTNLNNRKNVVFHRNALGNQNKWVEMSPYYPYNEGGVGIGTGGDRVEMKRLDNYGLQNVSMIKIDVEGAEMEVIEGAKQTILQNKPVMVVEIMGGTAYSNASPEQKTEIHRRMNKIAELGYSVHPIGMHDYLCIPRGRSHLQVRGSTHQ